MMFSAGRRRILDGLNRRYIYGRFVCVLSLLCSLAALAIWSCALRIATVKGPILSSLSLQYPSH